MTLKTLLLSQSLLWMTACVSEKQAPEPSTTFQESAKTASAQRIQIGRYASRGLWTPSGSKAPAVLLLPGSGQQGPEEMMPGSITVDGKDTSIFADVSEPFVKAGFNVLALGKPGVEFFTTWDPTTRIYDLELLKNLTWPQLVENASDGLDFLRNQDPVDPDQIYILGHSEGTQVAVDVVKNHNARGMILLGYSGEDFLTTLRFQLFQREIDYFLKTDLDANGDGFVSKAEAANWPEFSWGWTEGQVRVAVTEIEQVVRNNPQKIEFIEHVKASPYCQTGNCERGPLYDETARFNGSIYVFTGELDLQTRAREALELEKTCRNTGKENCFVEIVPGVQHGFSPPRPPRSHPIWDATVGPVENSFKQRLAKLADTLYAEYLKEQ